MHASQRLFAAGALGLFIALGSAAASAETTDGSDYHPLQMSSPESAQVQASAIAAAHPGSTEALGQSTVMPMPVSDASMGDSVYRGALAAARPAGTEAIGQSTGMPMVRSGSGS